MEPEEQQQTDMQEDLENLESSDLEIPVDQSENEEDWEHKYKTLQGKYNAEIGRLQQSNIELESKISALEKLIQNLSSTEKSKEIPEELSVLKDTLPDLYEVLTKHFVKRSDISELENKILSKIQTTTQKSFFAEMNRLVPDWQQINTNPDFLEWLKQKAPYSRKTLHELMIEAYNEGDAEAVAKFFMDYKKYRTPSARGSEIAPPRRQGVTSGGVSPRLIKREEVMEFYKNAALGKYPPEQKAKIEKEILSAAQENRIID